MRNQQYRWMFLGMLSRCRGLLFWIMDYSVHRKWLGDIASHNIYQAIHHLDIAIRAVASKSSKSR